MKHNNPDTARRASLVAAILASISASLCCIGPLMAVISGAGGFAASTASEKWRPVFLGVTFASLAFAWYATYHKPNAGCEEDPACPAKPVSKWSRRILWFATGFVLVAAALPNLSSAIRRPGSMTSGACCAGPAGAAENPSTTAQPSNVKDLPPDRISIFQVELRCPAAPQIGCGSAAKPVLLSLERDPNVSQAWLNQTGTMIAVVWKAESKAEARRSVIANFGNENATELTGKPRETAMAEFLSGSGWYRGKNVDRLSEEEADIIAARLVRRIQAKTTLSKEKADGLQLAISDAFKKRLTDEKARQEQNALLHSDSGLQQFAGKYLSKEQIPVLKEALASGVRPLAGEE